MRRELKFRAWCKSDFKTKDGALLFTQKVIDGDLYFVCAKDSDIKYLFKDILMDDDWIIEQYTGLKDINKKDIYEGDICKASKSNSYLDGNYEVRWQDKKGRWGYIDPRYNRFNSYQVGCAGNLKCEVVGNIYQNPELLK